MSLKCLEGVSRTLKMVVFDLDYTLWPLYCDCHILAPIQRIDDKVVDSSNTTVTLYPDVVEVLTALKSNNIPMAAASRTHDPPVAERLLELFGLNQFFSVKEIYPGSKHAHFEKIKAKSHAEYADMLFFDDEARNIRDISGLGVTTHLVKNGLTLKDLEAGINKFL